MQSAITPRVTSSVKVPLNPRRKSLLRSVPASTRVRATTSIKSPLRTNTRTRCPPLNASNTTRPSLTATSQKIAITGRATTFGTTGVSRAPLYSTSRINPLRNVTNIPPNERRQPGKIQTVKKPSEIEVLRTKVKENESKISDLEKSNEMKSEMIQMLRDSSENIKSSHEMEKQRNELLTVENSRLKELLEFAKSKVTNLEEENKKLKNQLEEKEKSLRVLHNSVVDLRGQIRVVIRVRPLLPSEADDSATRITYPSRTSIAFDPSSKFEFENVFNPVFSQADVFDKIQELIQCCLHGYNVGLIAFGQTGSGKTYTMRGGDGQNEGVIPRTAQFLFVEAEKLKSLGWQFEFSLSFIEIYNNETFDLLNNRQKLKLRLVGQDVSVDGLTEHVVSNKSAVNRLLNLADLSRKTAATKCNEQSSRSHGVFQWTIKAHQEATGINTTSMLKLVDLAGSERVKESGVTGDQFKEMTCINQSLSCLQKCISLQKSKSSHVPYRDSKLTQLLKDCLGAGSSKTMVIVNINPSDCQVQESKRSIEFAAKMRDTRIGTAVQQRDLNDSRAKQL